MWNVTGTTSTPAGAKLGEIAKATGVRAAVRMMHRYAYVGADLQDPYGIEPTSIGRVTTMANAYFANGDAKAALATLAATPDGILVSEETVNDFQLNQGDKLNLRLQSAVDHQYHVVPFTFVGVVREFPTAPKDSCESRASTSRKRPEATRARSCLCGRRIPLQPRRI